MIDWTGTYIITYNIIFGMKKGLTWVPRHSLKTSQGGGGGTPSILPLDPPLGFFLSSMAFSIYEVVPSHARETSARSV